MNVSTPYLWEPMLFLALVFAVSPHAKAQDVVRAVRPGRYDGTAFNTTAGQAGKAILEILDVEASGKVSAHFVASDGLQGEAWLSGTADASGVLVLSGKLGDWDMSVRAVPDAGGTLTATYQLRGPSAQDGTFKVRFRSAAEPVLAPGNPPLTQSTIDSFLAAYEIMFDLHLSPDEKSRIERQIIASWRKDDRRVIERILGDVKTVGGKNREEIRNTIGPGYQTTLVEAARRYSGQDPVIDLLVAAFDRAHPDGAQTTRARGLADLVGTWKKEDYLTPSKNPITHLAIGPSWQDGGTITVQPGGEFKFIHVHNHCDNAPGRNCCRLDGYTWQGTLAIEHGDLAFNIRSGGTSHQDSCMPSMNRNTVLSSQKETASWQFRLNPAHDNAPAICMHPRSGEAGCYTKQ